MEVSKVTFATFYSIFESEFNFLDLRLLKAAIAALTFIIEKASKYECLPEDLEKEMLQLGMSTGEPESEGYILLKGWFIF